MRNGVIVIEVKPGSYAGRFVRPGDMIVAVNGQEVKNVADLKKRSPAASRASASAARAWSTTVQFR